jgi:hypothetical protein
MEMNGKIIPLFGSLSEGNGMKHSFLIPSKPQFSFPPKLEEIGGNEIFTKTPKMPLIYFFLNTKLSLIPHLHIYIYIYIYVITYILYIYDVEVIGAS